MKRPKFQTSAIKFTTVETIFAKYITDKGLLSRYYKESYTTIKKNNPTEKQAKDKNKHITEEL